ncbi:MAG: pyridoxine 5'-phosphate synthase [Desulfobulbaceae bacterium]|nr:pyridoxine 5'-phosphate synthase [Desulfobulbaceae bacterium]
MAFNFFFQLDTVSYPFNSELIQLRAARLTDFLDLQKNHVSVVFMDDEKITSYNSRYRQRKGPTNVLSFPAEGFPEEFAEASSLNELGDILISVETAEREILGEKKSLNDRLTELMIHGLLHLLGYDHERSDDDAHLMWRKEKELFHKIKRFRSKSMVQLAINVDHVATIREARGISEPDPVLAAGICELAGASGIVVHLREDRRHINDRDVHLLRQTVKTKLNLEMAAAKEIIDIALDIKPDMVTLVPEKRQELTTEGGLNVSANKKKLVRTIEKMEKAGIPVSLFIDPDHKQIKAAKEVGATFVELHTGRYCDAENKKEKDLEFRMIEESAETASQAGLRVNAGHGLDYQTTSRIAALETIEELSIGHAIITRAVFVGLDQAVREMLALLKPPFQVN